MIERHQLQREELPAIKIRVVHLSELLIARFFGLFGEIDRLRGACLGAFPRDVAVRSVRVVNLNALGNAVEPGIEMNKIRRVAHVNSESERDELCKDVLDDSLRESTHLLCDFRSQKSSYARIVYNL